MRVLYISRHAEDVIVHHQIVKPGVAFLQKPFTREGLAKKTQEVLGTSDGITDKYREACQ